MASTQSDLNKAAGSAADDGVAIDGLRPAVILTPQSPEEVAEVLATADREGHGIAPVGGGTKLGIGNTPRKLDCVLSTRALDKVLHYEPTDLTLSVQAGMRFGDAQALLAEQGQTLPVEVPDSGDATIGGMIATAMAGPRRLGSGTLRDLLIGIAVAYPSGIVGKAGGMVVKNVTGFDLMRLHLGALGTLGVVVSANFKVLPAAREEATLISSPLSLQEALTLATASRRSRLRPIAVEVVKDERGWLTAVRLEGRPETVAIGVKDQQSVTAWNTIFQSDESRDWWKRYLARQSLFGASDVVVLRCAVIPKQIEAAMPRLTEAFAEHDISPELFAVSPGLGSMIARFRPNGTNTASLRPLQQALLEVADSVTVLSSPPALKHDLDVWGRAPETVSVMRALKAEFDPNNVLNPGRFVDGI